ncbi:AAA family ATPase [Candidatus Micrarchaeota archaeon]|nr:AAA family ATPase [Candidatus Micrarchaeota archaeon]
MNYFSEFGGSIFKKEEAFYPDYLPENIVYRENELKQMAYNLSALLKRRTGVGTLLWGTPGTGKTSSARYITKELSEEAQFVLPIYINCWECRTRPAVLTTIIEKLGGFSPRRGVGADEMLKEMIFLIEKSKKIPVFILDEMDTLKSDRILYDIGRLRENHSLNYGFIGILNKLEFLNKVDRRIRSSLLQSLIEFRAYKPSELKSILLERAKVGLIPGSYGGDVMGVCAGFGAKREGDARIAINLLWRAGRHAEREGKNRIELNDVESIKENNEPESKINKEEKKVVELLKKGELSFKEIIKKIGKTERMVRNYVNSLEKKGILKKRKEGKTIFISLGKRK